MGRKAPSTRNRSVTRIDCKNKRSHGNVDPTAEEVPFECDFFFSSIASSPRDVTPLYTMRAFNGLLALDLDASTGTLSHSKRNNTDVERLTIKVIVTVACHSTYRGKPFHQRIDLQYCNPFMEASRTALPFGDRHRHTFLYKAVLIVKSEIISARPISAVSLCDRRNYPGIFHVSISTTNGRADF